MQLVKSPDPWLEKKVDEFDFESLDAKAISDEMISIMTEEGGIGLSANQVALNAQIFVMKPYLLEDKPIQPMPVCPAHYRDREKRWGS